jgi:pimeloyl-ACP methyl ester carboxylesterase
MKIRANGIAIEAEDTHPGDASRPAVLLVMGLGMQLVAWPQPFIDALVAQGYRVVRFDNRDIGLSQHFNELGVPNLVWESMKFRFGLPVRAPYALHDMAADALGVMDALGIARAHVVGVSMGGMIAQRIALAAPQRTLSLTSVMSSSGARYLPGPRAHVLKALFSRPQGEGRDAWVEHYLKFFRIIGSPGFPSDEQVLRERIRLSVQRSFNPAGTVRQIAAVAADTRRADELVTLRRPALVVHGKADPMVPLACGIDTARRIPGARLVTVDGMGHDLPPGVVDRLLSELLPHMQSAGSAT